MIRIEILASVPSTPNQVAYATRKLFNEISELTDIVIHEIHVTEEDA